MKIVLTVHQFLPEFTMGTEIVVLNTARELRRRGHDVRIITGAPGPLEAEDADRFDAYIYDGFKVERFLHAWTPMAGQTNVVELEYNNPLFYRFFRDYLSENRPDLVHFFHLGRLSASALDACQEAQVPNVFTATDFWGICPTSQLRLWDNTLCAGPDPQASNCIRHLAMNSGHRLVKALPDSALRVLVKACQWQALQGWPRVQWIQAAANRPAHILKRLSQVDRVIAPSRVMRERLLAAGLDDQQLLTLPYGIALHRIRRMDDKGQHRVLRIGFIGALSEHKGCHLLIQAFRALPWDTPASLCIFGAASSSPEYQEQLRQAAAADDRVTFCGGFANDAVGDVLSQLDVVVVPSIWYENTPVVMYEALAAGCVVVASDVAGISEVVRHGENGLLFAPGSVGDLAACLHHLSEDRERVTSLARRTRAPLAIEEHVSILESLYREILSGSKAESAAALTE